ncbi:MAG TPA: transcriptional regulator NanR [Rhodobacteraceae bacterium]|nr:transcriptional regulator NanR [Paracoccaceae bacterium]
MAEQITAASIARLIASEVHAGAHSPGEMLPAERDLCERFGVGRNVIREALTILQGMGLTVQEKGRRPRVVTPTLQNVMESTREAAQFFFSGSEGLAHLEQARLFLETSLVRYAVVHATNAQIAKMLEASRVCDANLDNIEGFREGDVQFHRAIAEVPGNPIFAALHDTFVEKLMRNRPALPDFRERNKISNDEHRTILQAILDKDAERAVEVLTKHLTRNYGTYFRLVLDQRAEATAQLNSSIQEEETHE